MATPVNLVGVAFSPPIQKCDSTAVTIGVKALMMAAMPLARWAWASGNNAKGMA
ncbi:hypothetical protein D3C87_2048890 [compost metagenome]